MGLERDKAADRRRGALAHCDAHALQRLGDAPTFDALHAHGDAVAALALLAHLDKARKRGAPDSILQDRVCQPRGLHRRNRKTC